MQQLYYLFFDLSKLLSMLNKGACPVGSIPCQFISFKMVNRHPSYQYIPVQGFSRGRLHTLFFQLSIRLSGIPALY